MTLVKKLGSLILLIFFIDLCLKILDVIFVYTGFVGLFISTTSGMCLMVYGLYTIFKNIHERYNE